MNKKLLDLKCSQCSSFFKPFEVLYNCPKCGGVLETIYDYKEIEGNFKGEDLWRYSEFLPTTNRSNLLVGSTPLYKSKSLKKELGIEEIWIKDDTKNPTGSLKDRASAVVAVLAKELGYRTVACASTGNAASSLAGISAAEGLESYIFAPRSMSLPKLVQLQVFNARILKINASYDECFELCNKITERYGWYNRNTAYNPYTLDGKKTVTFEIAEQLDWKVPDLVVVPVGDGCIISSVWKGFRELKEVGIIDELPRLIGVQAEGCKPLKDAFDRNKEKPEVTTPKTLAESIAVGEARNGLMALRDVRESKGKFVSVSDNEMLDAVKLLASSTGIFGELAGVASIAAIKKEVIDGNLDREDRIVALITGSGLKDIEVTSKLLDRVQTIEPREKEICERIEEIRKR
ncbi:MAG TPA: threonine synthase [Thermoplasmata archaeon]|nr:threonine synthase [Thermoplasmata archaeon]